LGDKRGSLRSGPFLTPRNGPFVDDEHAHVAKSAEEEDLLRQPLEKEIDVIFEMKGVQSFQKDG